MPSTLWRARLLLLVTASCGGKTVDQGSDGGGSTSLPCPGSAPTPGGACSTSGLQCEYGSNPLVACNTVLGCTSGTWTEQPGATSCLPQSNCPTSFALVPVNEGCQTWQAGIGCSYPDGVCFCGTGGVHIQPSWFCFASTTTCPNPRPDIGTACSMEGSMCDYGSCLGGVALSCKQGIWQRVETPCPG